MGRGGGPSRGLAAEVEQLAVPSRRQDRFAPTRRKTPLPPRGEDAGKHLVHGQRETFSGRPEQRRLLIPDIWYTVYRSAPADSSDGHSRVPGQAAPASLRVGLAARRVRVHRRGGRAGRATDRRLALGRQGPDSRRRPRARRGREDGGLRAGRARDGARDAGLAAGDAPDRQRGRARPPRLRRGRVPGRERALPRPRTRPHRFAYRAGRLRRRRNVHRVGRGGAAGAHLPGRHRPGRRARRGRRAAPRRRHRPRRAACGRRRTPDDRALRRVPRLRRVAHRDQPAGAHPGWRAAWPSTPR